MLRQAAAGILALAVFFAGSPGLQASVAAAPYLRKAEIQRYRWLGIQAEADLKFTSASGQSASCSGRLTYYRLEERMLLECLNARRETLFIFSTREMDFELYLAADKTVYRGNIFDLEDSDSISSHIKPLDLYRSLKSMPVLPEQAAVVSESRGAAVLQIYQTWKGRSFISRVISITERGDVPYESYLDREGRETLLISRDRFTDIGSVPKRKEERIYFPKQILIMNPKENTRTEILFSSVKALSKTSGAGWVIQFPEGTKVWELPRFDPEWGYNPPPASSS
ncbi:MAG: hypothetical protein FGM27_05255 [Candidatus Omnitrophica bacterium]|nr:hypothetical protein [Candidatus Omnitrophota bacterium]